MPASSQPNRRRRLRPAFVVYRNNNQSKLASSKWTFTIKFIKLASAILVPVMIGIFTVVTTLQESQRAQLQRNSDMEKIGRQAQLQREMDAVKMKEQQEYDESNLREERIQNVYDAFIRDMSSIVLKYNLNLTVSEVIVARAKTLATLEQIDPRRKWYLIKFLYDSQLLYGNKSGMRFIDLADADLSNVQFSVEKRFARRLELEGIRLSRVQLRSSLFENIGLNRAIFRYSSLNNSNFIGVSIAGADFRDTILENSNFVLHNLQETSFRDSSLKLSSWSFRTPSSTPGWPKIDYSNCDLSESSFQGMIFEASVKFDQANLERINFSNMKFSNGTSFRDLHMPFSKFNNVTLMHGNFTRCNMTGAIIAAPHFRNILFYYVDLRQSQFNDISDSRGMQFINTNLADSNLNINSQGITLIKDSFLPNKTFKTSFTKFGINLLENSDAEQGQCYNTDQTSMEAAPHGWFRENDAIQMSYTNNDWTRNIINYTRDWGACFFAGSDPYPLAQGKSNTNIMRQKINIEQLSVLIDSRQAKYHASAYLGGLGSQSSLTTMRIIFKDLQNKTKTDLLVGS